MLVLMSLVLCLSHKCEPGLNVRFQASVRPDFGSVRPKNFVRDFPRRMFICSKLWPNLSGMEVWTFVSIKESNLEPFADF